jgi:hypothetical protein
MKNKCIQCGKADPNTLIEGGLCNACYWMNKATLHKQELLSFAKKLLDDDEINKENLDYWADEYLHAYNALANVMEIDDKRRKAEQQRDELLEVLEKVKQGRENRTDLPFGYKTYKIVCEAISKVKGRRSDKKRI